MIPGTTWYCHIADETCFADLADDTGSESLLPGFQIERAGVSIELEGNEESVATVDVPIAHFHGNIRTIASV